MLGIILLVLIVINWLLYHKFVHVIYLGSMRKSITNEFIWATIAACIELALIMTIGQIVLVVIVVIGLIVGFILAFREIYKFIKELKGVTGKSKANKTKNTHKAKTNTGNNESVEHQNQLDDTEIIQEETEPKDTIKQNNIMETEVSEIKSESVFCTHCGNKIPRSSKFCTFCGANNNYRR